MSSHRILAVAAALMLVTGVAHAGGRARVLVLTAPKQVVAGQAFELAFSVRSQFPMSRELKLEPIVRAVCGDQILTIAATPMKTHGQYRAAITLPRAGDWSIAVDSRYCETVMDPLTLKAEAPAEKRPQAVRS
ncbi:MAG: hypothetical protein HYR74_00285 [Candidatus Eisenbacteria bacterium]|nr:hypothetical protein [Candidatus Eisenbacteria bacterium]